MPDTKQRVRFVQVPAEHVAAFKSAPKNDDGVLYFLMGEIPELWFDNRRIAIDDNIAHTFMAQKLGTEGSDAYTVEHNNGMLSIKTNDGKALTQIKLSNGEILVSNAFGNPVEFYDIKDDMSATLSTDTYKYPIYTAALPGIQNKPNSFADCCKYFDDFSYAIEGVVFDISAPLVDGVTYLFMGDDVFRVDYVNNTPSKVTSVYSHKHKTDIPETEAKVYNIGAEIKLTTDATSTANLFSPNGYHTFLYYTNGIKYYVMSAGNIYKKTTPAKIVDGQYSYGTKAYSIAEDRKTAGVYTAAFANYDLISAVRGRSNLITTKSDYCLVSSWALWGTQGTEYVPESKLGIFSYNYGHEIQSSGGSTYTINRVHPTGNYQLVKIQDKGNLVIETGEEIQCAEAVIRGFEHDSHSEIAPAGIRYTQFIQVDRWKHPGDTSYTSRSRLFVRTLVVDVKTSSDGSALVAPWSYAREILTTADSLDVTECHNAVTWGTF